jgi:F-type H+-transporting ATPase subunit delta
VATSDELVRGYAQALFAVAQAEGELESVEAQLYAFARLIEREDRLRDALNDPSLPLENKRSLIRDTLGDHANPIVVNLLSLLIEQGRAREIDRVIDAMADVSAESRRYVLAEVRSAVPLDAGQRERLARALSEATGRDVEVRVAVDPDVIGGLVARVGDEIFDGSLRSRLADARQHLTGTTERGKR